MCLKHGVVSDCIVATHTMPIQLVFKCQRDFDQVQGLHDVFLINSREYLFTGSRDMGCKVLTIDQLQRNLQCV